MKLNTNHKTLLYILLSIFCVSIIAVCCYYLLGGFKEVILFELKNNVHSIAGKEFKGKINNDTIGIYFNEMKLIIENGNLKGDLCLVNYQDKELTEKEVHQFIGILLEDDITEIPSGFKVIEIESEISFNVALIMHPLIQPNSEKVQAMIYDFAQKKEYELENYSLEIFYPDNSVIIEMFGLEKNN